MDTLFSCTATSQMPDWDAQNHSMPLCPESRPIVCILRLVDILKVGYPALTDVPITTEVLENDSCLVLKLFRSSDGNVSEVVNAEFVSLAPTTGANERLIEVRIPLSSEDGEEIAEGLENSLNEAVSHGIVSVQFRDAAISNLGTIVAALENTTRPNRKGQYLIQIHFRARELDYARGDFFTLAAFAVVEATDTIWEQIKA